MKIEILKKSGFGEVLVQFWIRIRILREKLSIISDMLTHSRTVPGWCGDEGEGELVIQKPPKHTEMKEN